MTTVTVCDYPDCPVTAAWKIELSDLRGRIWPPEVIGQRSPRRSMDICDRHLAQVTFDQDKIAEFETGLP